MAKPTVPSPYLAIRQFIKDTPVEQLSVQIIKDKMVEFYGEFNLVRQVDDLEYVFYNTTADKKYLIMQVLGH